VRHGGARSASGPGGAPPAPGTRGRKISASLRQRPSCPVRSRQPGALWPGGRSHWLKRRRRWRGFDERNQVTVKTSAAATRTAEAVREGLTRATALDQRLGVSKNLQAGVATGFASLGARMNLFGLVLSTCHGCVFRVRAQVGRESIGRALGRSCPAGIVAGPCSGCPRPRWAFGSALRALEARAPLFLGLSKERSSRWRRGGSRPSGKSCVLRLLASLRCTCFQASHRYSVP